MTERTWPKLLGIIAVLFLIASIAVPLIRSPEFTPVMRGHKLSENLGCFGCHGPGGTGGLAPAWNSETAPNYIDNEDEIAEWILDGIPARLANKKVENDGLLIAMPAYRDVISESELSDLIAYFKVIAEYQRPMPPRIKQGYQTARNFGCFSCHKIKGQFGIPNPKSFKGYIPPWDGADFADIARNDDEIREWILKGQPERLKNSQFAQKFLKEQVIRMPVFDGYLSVEQVDLIIEYIHWLRIEAGLEVATARTSVAIDSTRG